MPPGGVGGGVTGILGVDQRPRFHRYVVEERRPSSRYEGDVRVGAVLPEAGITYMRSRRSMVFANIATRSSTSSRACVLTLNPCLLY
jgi:hypothetical protein